MQTAITRFYVHAEFPVSHPNTAGASSQHAWVIIINGHQAALLTAALTREAGAAVTVRTYWAWESWKLLLRCGVLGGVRRFCANRERRGIKSNVC